MELGVSYMRRIRLEGNKWGQSALFDAIMFLIIMLLASMIVYTYIADAFRSQEIISYEDMSAYAEETKHALIQSTLNHTWYFDKTGSNISKPPGSTNIYDLLLEELSLLDDGVPIDNFADGYEKHINKTARMLIRTGYHYAIYATYTNSETNDASWILISDIINNISGLPDERISILWHPPMMKEGQSGNATIAFYIWRE